MVFTSFIQYRLYASSYFNKDKKQQIANNMGFFQRNPRMARFFVVCSKIIEMSVPWVCYCVFVIIAIVNDLSLIHI